VARVDADGASRAFRDTADDLDGGAMDPAYADLAREAADTMRGFMPSRTGRARRSVRPERAEGRAVVTAGGPEAPYVPVLRANHPSRFVPRTDAAMEQRTADRLEQEWDHIATRNGLI
jgi:hypothetical protein